MLADGTVRESMGLVRAEAVMLAAFIVVSSSNSADVISKDR